ncbi:MAG: branched-chain amino acid aminotransferase [Minwuiales bacterium]|nr:branched-chain amino acid aminotransferase [Minwuiales bacterium]
MAGVFWHDGKWSEEQPKLTGPMDHAFWMSTVVFDGARSFQGMAPDVDQHCERLIKSAKSMLLEPKFAAEEVAKLCVEGVRKLPKESELYIRPMFFAREGFVLPDPETTDFVLAIYDTPLPPANGFTACFSSYRRPARDMAPTDAKASCLYPNSQRALREAANRGFDNAIVLDPNGNVAEFASANIWIAKDGVAMTPAWNGTFLNGITRQRIIQLLKDDGVEVQETTITPQDVRDADEVFNTGNYGKVVPVVKLEDRDLQPGPVARRARELYFEYANSAQLF